MPYTTQTSDFWGWYLRHNNRLVWKHLFDAGVDVFASGPSNNTQAFLQLTNILPSMTGGFLRRWGNRTLNTNGGGGFLPNASQVIRTFFYNAPQDQTNLANTVAANLIIPTDNQEGFLYDDGGNPWIYSQGPYNIFLTNFANPGNFWALTSRQWFYYGNGVNTPRKNQLNYITKNTDSNIGISLPVNGSPTTYASYPSAQSLVGTSGSGYTSPPTVTITDLGGSGHSCAITTTINAAGQVTGATITNKGTAYTNAYATLSAPPGGGTQAYLTLYTQQNSAAANYGSVMGYDLAGPMSFIQGRRYGVALQNSTSGHTSDVAMSVVGQNAINDLPYGPKSGSGYLALADIYNAPLAGSSSVYPVYVTSTTSAGQLQSAGFTQITMTITVPGASHGLDPQVDTVVLLATSDGGDVGTLYQVTTIPLSSFTLSGGVYSYVYSDTLPDSFNSATNIYNTTNTLLNSNIWAEEDNAGNSFGISLNTPPVATSFLYPIVHQGRMFATDGKSLFFSKSLDEVTTSTGLITSKWEECWPGDYVLPLALGNEQIQGLISDGTNLHIGTEKSIFTLYGTSPSNFEVPSVAFAETGIMSNDAWSVIYAEGQPSGFVWITPDFKVMHSDFSTYREIGTPIYPILQTMYSNLKKYTKVVSFSQGPYNFVVLSFNRNGDTNFQPEFWIWESRLQKWYQWVLNGNAIGQYTTVYTPFVYQTPAYSTTSPFPSGSKKLYFWALNGTTVYLQYFDPSLVCDYTLGNNRTVNIPWSVQTSWQDCGDNTAIKVVNEVEFTGDDGPLTVTLLGATSSYQFETLGGVTLASGVSKQGPIFALGTQKFYCAGSPTAAKYYSLQFAPVTPGIGPTVLSSFELEYYPMARI